jgi:RNA polymerase sigma factor (sigma-70 family)
MEDPYQTRVTLIERVKNPNDETSWEDFVTIYKGYIYTIIRNMNLSEHDTEDIIQQVLLKLWKKLPETYLSKIKRFRSWLTATTKNCVIDFIRKRTNDAQRLEKAKRDTTLAYLKTISLPENDVSMEKDWQIYLVNLALTNISPLFSGHAITVFRLSLSGMDAETIAAKLNIQKKSVSRLQLRVKNRLTAEVHRLKADLD